MLAHKWIPISFVGNIQLYTCCDLWSCQVKQRNHLHQHVCMGGPMVFATYHECPKNRKITRANWCWRGKQVHPSSTITILHPLTVHTSLENKTYKRYIPTSLVQFPFSPVALPTSLPYSRPSLPWDLHKYPPSAVQSLWLLHLGNWNSLSFRHTGKAEAPRPLLCRLTAILAAACTWRHPWKFLKFEQSLYITHLLRFFSMDLLTWHMARPWFKSTVFTSQFNW